MCQLLFLYHVQYMFVWFSDITEKCALIQHNSLNHLQPFLSAFLLLLLHHKNKTQITKQSLLLLNVNYANDCGKLWVNLNEEEHWETNTKANTNYYQYLSFLLHFSWLGFPSAKQISSLIMHLTDVQINLGFFTKTLMFLWSRIAPFPLLFFQPI